jgi:uncharacterized protein (DUF2384 family)
MLLDADRGARQVLSVMSRMRKRDNKVERCVGMSVASRLDVRALTKTFGLTTLQVAKMLGIVPAELRRRSTSPNVRDGLRRLTSLLSSVSRMFGGDTDAVKDWLKGPHPALGRVTPMKYLVDGHVAQVESLVDAYVSGQPD